MKAWKKFNLLLLGMLTAFIFIGDANAAQGACSTHKNYYFFIEIEHANTFEKGVADNKVWSMENQTYFPRLEAASGQTIDIVDEGIVCLKRSDNDTESCASSKASETWTLEKFYNGYKSARKSSDVVEFTANGTLSESHIYTTGNTKYLTHSTWAKIENGSVVPVTGGVNLSNESTSAMANASALPFELNIIRDTSIKDNITTNIQRKINLAKYNSNITAFDVAWSEGADPQPSIVSPALYFIEYEVCNSDYTATIKYIDAETKKEVANSWTKSGLSNGHSETVTSPTVANCVPNKKSVNVSINNKDFFTEVEYTCEIKNPQTGGILIAGIVIVALVSLGFALYYFKFRKKEEN